MPKPKPVDNLFDDSDRRRWSTSHGTYIAGRAYVDEADQTAAEMEGKWGADRLRLLVGPELREKFDRQRYLFNQAIWHGELEDVRREANRMIKGWLALDKAAAAAGRAGLDRQVWEIPLKDGSVAMLVQDNLHAERVAPEGRRGALYTLEEIGRLLSAYPELAKAKMTFPGAEVVQVRRCIGDPLDAVHDTARPIDDPLPF